MDKVIPGFGLAPVEIVFLVVALIGFAFWIWALVDCALRCPRERRAIWIVIIALLHFVGALLYLLFRKGLPRRAGGEHASG